MSSTFLGLQIGRSGLSAAQVALNITGQNISNADTEGYTRQRVSTAAIPAGGSGYLISQVLPSTNVGQGVDITSITQIRSDYLDAQYRDQYADYSSSEYMTQGLSYLEDLFNELDDDTSLTVSISNFFDALSDFSEDPTSEAARTTVQQSALSMSENFNLIFNEMVDLYNSQNTSIKTVATQINETAREIAELNEAIATYEITGESANDLRDQRNVLLDKLSGYSNVSFSEDSRGMVSVALSGQTLVDGDTYNEITITTATDEINTICQQLADLNDDIITAGSATAAQITERDTLIGVLESISGKMNCTVNADDTVTVNIDYVDSTTTSVSDTLVSGSTFTATTSDAVIEYPGADDEYVLKLGDTYLNTDTVESGELAAHLQLREGNSTADSGIPYYISQLDELAQQLVQSVNECMNTGYTYPDAENGYTSVTGVDMFMDFGDNYNLVTAGNFTLSTAVSESVWNIAASDTVIDLSSTNTQSANNVIALELADLINTNDYGGTLDGIVSHLGVSLNGVTNSLDTQQSLLESTENQRTSISGVSLDEEAVNLIKYQQTYNACSRMITTMDELLDKLINSTGTVGR